jgi:hypothetical protein
VNLSCGGGITLQGLSGVGAKELAAMLAESGLMDTCKLHVDASLAIKKVSCVQAGGGKAAGKIQARHRKARGGDGGIHKNPATARQKNQVHEQSAPKKQCAQKARAVKNQHLV